MSEQKKVKDKKLVLRIALFFAMVIFFEVGLMAGGDIEEIVNNEGKTVVAFEEESGSYIAYPNGEQVYIDKVGQEVQAQDRHLQLQGDRQHEGREGLLQLGIHLIQEGHGHLGDDGAHFGCSAGQG